MMQETIIKLEFSRKARGLEPPEHQLMDNLIKFLRHSTIKQESFLIIVHLTKYMYSASGIIYT